MSSCSCRLAVLFAATVTTSAAAQTFERRAADLVGRMTLEEKVSQMMDRAPATERLGIPEYNWWNEGLHGVARSGLATVFPQAIGFAATWNDSLVLRMASVISDEFRAKHHEYVGQETYGEDPYLTGRLAVQFIRGLQGDDPRYLKAVATVKHFAVHSGPEPERHEFDAQVSERDLRESYLPHFEMAIREGGAYSLMCAYNRVYGKPACGNDLLLQRILRGEWRFPGYVVSDCGAIGDMYLRHKVVPTAAAAAALGVHTGTDLDCGNEYASLIDAVHQGLITEQQIDTSLIRLFVARFRLGMFDPPEQVKWARIPITVLDDSSHRVLARRVARESIVLLKNAGHLLPLRPRHDRGHRAQRRPMAYAARQLQRHSSRSGHAAARHPRGGVAAHARPVRPRLGPGGRVPRACPRPGVGAVDGARAARAGRRFLREPDDVGCAAVRAGGLDARRALGRGSAARRHERR